MQALRLDAQYGLRWIAGGWRMLRRQPVGFIALLFLFWLLLLGASVVIGFVAQGIGAAIPSVSADAIAAAGSLLFAAITPALTVGFLQACRLAATGARIHPLLLFAPFRAGRVVVRRLLGLGLIEVAALFAILFALNGGDALLVDAPDATPPAASTASRPSTAASNAPAASNPSTASTPSPRAPTEAKPSPQATNDDAAARAADDEATRRRATELAEQGLAYLPVALLMWYAPMLVAWHGVPVGKALFFSLVGVWRNRAAFAVYGVAWVAIWMAASTVIALVSLATGIGNVAAIVVAPLAMVMLTCMYCSMYESYATVYVDTSAPPSPAP